MGRVGGCRMGGWWVREGGGGKGSGIILCMRGISLRLVDVLEIGIHEV